MPSLLDQLHHIAREARKRVPVPPRVRAILQRFAPHQAEAQPATVVATHEAPPATAPAPAVEKQMSWELRTQAELVDHIVARYHEGARRELPALVEAARRIAREHAAHPAVPRELADDLAAFQSELESHMLKEESMLFPMLRTGARGGQLDMPIRMMERDHEGHDEHLDRIREHTANLVAPPDATEAWKALYRGIETFETDLRQHVYLENNILFARAAGERDE